MSSDQIEDVTSALSEMGINIVENDDAGEDTEAQAQQDEADDETPADEDGPPQLHQIEKKKETIDRTDDPVRMYLREMGAVELLSREARSRSPSGSRPAATR